MSTVTFTFEVEATKLGMIPTLLRDAAAEYEKKMAEGTHKELGANAVLVEESRGNYNKLRVKATVIENLDGTVAAVVQGVKK